MTYLTLFIQLYWWLEVSFYTSQNFTFFGSCSQIKQTLKEMPSKNPT